MPVKQENVLPFCKPVLVFMGVKAKNLQECSRFFQEHSPEVRAFWFKMAGFCRLEAQSVCAVAEFPGKKREQRTIA